MFLVPIDLPFTPIKRRHADFLCGERTALLNVLASACDVWPADSQPFQAPWRSTDSGNASHGCSEVFFGAVAQTLSLAVRPRLDHIRSLATREQAAFIRFFDTISGFYALLFQLNKIKLKSVNLCFQGTDLYSHKNDKQRGPNQQFPVQTAEWRCFISDVNGGMRLLAGLTPSLSPSPSSLLAL